MRNPLSARSAMRRVGELVVVVVAVAASSFVSTLVSNSPAEAGCGGPQVYTKQYGGSRAGAGSVRFDCVGDHLYLCDHQPDGRSVVVELDYNSEENGPQRYDRWNWWGPYKYNGCKDINIDATEWSRVLYRVCLGVHGHPGGVPGHVNDASCSGWADGTA